MAIYSHKLSSKLSALFRSGHCTAERFAEMSELSLWVINGAARGETRVSPDAHLRIGKVLSGFTRMYPDVFEPIMRPAFVRSVNEPVRDCRGVFEEPQTFKGQRRFTIWNDEECLVEVIWPEWRATPERIEGLWRSLDKEYPEKTALRAI